MSKPISPLRQRMIDDMTMRNLSPNTQETYIRSIAQFSAFHRRSPNQLGVEHLRAFHLHLVSRGLVANSMDREALADAASECFNTDQFCWQESCYSGARA
jgi:integrase/recombinase XerD